MTDFLYEIAQFKLVELQLNIIALRWHAVAYIFGVLFVFFIIKRFNSREKFLTKAEMDDWMLYSIISVVIGGRIFYVLIENFDYFADNPLEIFMIWRGGVSFYGGLIGIICGMGLFCWKYKVRFLKIMDILAIATPAALFFGYMVNFINVEIHAAASIFSSDNKGLSDGFGGQNLTYFYKLLLIAAIEYIIFYLTIRFNNMKKEGLLSASFLILYGICEFGSISLIV